MKIKNYGRAFFCLLVLIFTSSTLLANIDLYEFSSEENQARYKVLTKELRCPKCQNQDIADSNAPIATDMRREVHRLLEEGQDNLSIVSFMVERFGEFVSYKPKVKPATYLLWYGPWVLLILGVVIIVFMAGRRASNKNRLSKDSAEQVKQSAQNDEEKQSALLNQHEQVEKLLTRFKDD